MTEVSCSCTFNWVMGLVKSAQQNGMLRFHDITGLLAADMHPRKLWYAEASSCDELFCNVSSVSVVTLYSTSSWLMGAHS